MNRMYPRFPANDRHAFTLVELLAVIAVIALVGGLLLSGITSALERAAMAKSMSNIASLQKANLLYAAEHGGNFMPVWSNNSDGDVSLQWYNQPLLADYIGLEQNANGANIWTHDTICPYADLAKDMIDEGEGHRAMNYSYGYNIDGGKGQWGQADASSARVGVKVERPTEVFAFVTALDWMVQSNKSTLYNGKEERLSNHMTAYRYNDGAVVVYFDGHVEWLPRDKVEVVGDQPEENYRRWNLGLDN